VSDWIKTEAILPAIGEVVHTKIDDDDHGPRNESKLKRGGANGRLWFTADDRMYVYYTPTHWRPL